MIQPLNTALQESRKEVYYLFQHFLDQEKTLLLRSEIQDVLRTHRGTKVGADFPGSVLEETFQKAQEAVVLSPSIYVAVRRGVSDWLYLQFHTENIQCRLLTVREFLLVKESLVLSPKEQQEWVADIDMAPFERGFPKLKETKSIGAGVEFLNRHLSSRLLDGSGEGFQRLLDFMKVHQYQTKQLMLNERIGKPDELRSSIRSAIAKLEEYEDDSTWKDFGFQLQELGFEPGWGRTAEQTKDTLALLSNILEAPDPGSVAEFLKRMPMIFRIAILSPHGYFGQANVLGKPDTGGQVVYILDQVRALEKHMRLTLEKQGLDDIEPQIVVITRMIPDCGDTTCDERIEPILGTESSRILRVPFRNEDGEIVPQWISRFKIWPYLEQFTLDSERELLAELGGRPDLIIGNYSDGNLVATILAHRMKVTGCTIAHALEKTKYLHSDLYWKDTEHDHFFSSQFSADLIAMNGADFIITSTFQEIAGTDTSIGQYESYQHFTLPGLYRVVHGIDLYDPKFNIVSPGADEEVFFPYTKKKERLTGLHDELNALVFGTPEVGFRGAFQDQEKPVIFAMSRIDPIKNVSGLVRWYAESPELREQVNLFIVGGVLDTELSNDDGEKRQIEIIHKLIAEFDLESQVRWVEAQTDKNRVGELYRFIADRGGAFIQPALFEAFGLTVIEAMISGLPVFATRFGGPREIIVNDESGFHIDPNRGARAAEIISTFFEKVQKDPNEWKRISDGAIKRVEERYTWKLYAKRLLGLSRIYGFWKFITHMERQETNRYLEMFYSMMYRERTKQIPR